MTFIDPTVYRTSLKNLINAVIDMSVLWIFTIVGLTGIIGGFIGWFLSSTTKKTALIESQIYLKKTKQEKDKLNEEVTTLRATYLNTEKKLSELSAEKKQREQIQEQFQTQFQTYFKNLSQDILENKSKQFQQSAEKNLSALLQPLKEKINTFQTKVEETYQAESRERFSLKDKIKELCEVHDRLKKETRHLSQTLKGDVKAQGQWGEVILNTLLEASGLQEEEHYITQGRGLKLKDEEGKQQKPDVIIKLPDNKHIIIDSKVSLTHYERYIANSNLEEEKQLQLQKFMSSLRTHILQLSKKEYSLSESLNTPDFVLMFFPIEGAFSLALQSDPQIFQFSWDRSIVIVSPTTLLATLKTVESIWKREKQNRNAIEIAQASGRLYDKFTSFTEDLNLIGSNLKKAEQSYSQALQKLHLGKGNIISRLEKIRKLGAKTSKKISENLLSPPNS